jgi:hypothetical protein
MKIYNTAYEPQRKALIEKVKWFVLNKKTVELKQWKPKRTGRQNKYLHVLLSLIAIDYCDTIEYVKKTLYKSRYNAELYEYEVTNKDGKRTALRSSKDLTTQEMALSVDRLREGYMRDKGCYLPDAHEDLSIYEAEIQKYENQRYI